ncbi:MAG: hypothetical protein IJU44_08610 [Kiritimatiellae bacterium]|nr:hypothetical protein [Kiritimatiellia bacterium]
MFKLKSGGCRRCSGQAMVEYVIVFVVLFGVVTAMALCLFTVRQQSDRALDLVASEYP